MGVLYFFHGCPYISAMKKTIHILGIPIDLGQTKRGVNMGTGAIRFAGLAARLEKLGFRVSLSSLARGTLDTDKSGDGLQAITWYREGKMDQLTAYCGDDVEITRKLYEYGREKGYVFFLDRYSGRKRQINVTW